MEVSIKGKTSWITEEQALRTRAIEVDVDHTRQDPSCRLCKEASETIQYIIVRCRMQVCMANKEYHKQVAGLVYMNICAVYGLEVPTSKWQIPPKVVENDRAKILLDLQIQTDKEVMVNCGGQ